MKFQGRSTTKRTGGRRRRVRKKRKHELGQAPTETRIGDARLKTVTVRGGEEKVRAIQADAAAVADGGETRPAELEGVVENGANPNYVRRNIVTKGAVVDTSEGYARVTSRPGQDGQVNAVLLDDYEPPE